MYSSSSVTSSPSRLRRSPQSVHRSPGVKNRLFARQMLRQGAALRLSLRTGRRGSGSTSAARAISSSSSPSSSWSSVSEPTPKRLPAQTRKLVLELLDQKIAVAELGVPRRQFGPRGEHHRLERGDIVGQVHPSFVEHAGTLAEKAAKGKPE